VDATNAGERVRRGEALSQLTVVTRENRVSRRETAADSVLLRDSAIKLWVTVVDEKGKPVLGQSEDQPAGRSEEMMAAQTSKPEAAHRHIIDWTIDLVDAHLASPEGAEPDPDRSPRGIISALNLLAADRGSK
jgi:hypothetical protein